MPTTYPLSTLSATITSAGIYAPSYSDILSSLKASMGLIYGSDVYLEPDSQDGQALAIFASAINDANQMAIATFNSFSPATAQGVGLSNVVKINHIARTVATNSQVNLTIGGTAGTTILNGKAGDSLGNRWDLPSYVLIPPAGTVVVTAKSEALGAVPALVGTVTDILTPTAGWQSVTNASAASLGQPVEADATLRTRQVISPALNAYTVMDGLIASLLAIEGVVYVRAYENDTGTTDSNGLPAHSVGIVLQGGDADTIANTIYLKKGLGVATYGSTSINVPDVSGALRAIKFSVPVQVPIKVAVAITVGSNYTTAIGERVKQSIADYINGLPIGDDLVIVRMYVPAMLNGAADEGTYKLTALTAALSPGGTLATTDITINFDAKATCTVSDITITVS